MSVSGHESEFGLSLTEAERSELAKRPLEMILDEAFTGLAAETDGSNSRQIINELHVHHANLLMGAFASRKEAYDGWKTQPDYTGEQIEMEGGIERLTIVLTDGPTGEILNIALNSSDIVAELKIAKDFDGEYDFMVFAPTIDATVRNADIRYSVVFGPGSISSIERTRYLETPRGNTKDTRKLEFADYIR